MEEVKKRFNRREPDLDLLPNLIFIESVIGCNLRCAMCPVPTSAKSMNGRKFHCMELDVYNVIMEQISETSREIWLNQLGEPLLNDNIVEFVKIAKKKGHTVCLTSNGTKLNSSLSHDLLSSGIDKVVFSFDSIDRNIYEKIRIGSNYERVLNNIREFSEIRHRLRAECKVQVDCIQNNLSSNEDNSKFWRGIADRVTFIPLDDWGGQFELPPEMGTRKSVEIPSRRFPCDLLWTTLSISAEGQVMYCCHDYKLQSGLSNVRERKLIDIWTREMGAERKKHVSGAIDRNPCKDCVAWATRPRRYSRFALSHFKMMFNKITGKPS